MVERETSGSRTPSVVGGPTTSSSPAVLRAHAEERFEHDTISVSRVSASLGSRSRRLIPSAPGVIVTVLVPDGATTGSHPTRVAVAARSAAQRSLAVPGEIDYLRIDVSGALGISLADSTGLDDGEYLVAPSPVVTAIGAFLTVTVEAPAEDGIAAIVLQNVLEKLVHATLTAAADRASRPAPETDVFAAAMTFIRSAFHRRELDLTMVAAETHTARWQLEHAFAAHETTVLHEIRRARAASAIGLLEDTAGEQLALPQIAALSGIGSTAQLTRLVRAETGFAPDDYRAHQSMLAMAGALPAPGRAVRPSLSRRSGDSAQLDAG